MGTSLTPRQEALARLLISGVALTFALVLVELGLRVLRPDAVAIDRLPLIVQPDEALGFDYIPGATGYLERLEFRTRIRINPQGFYDDPFTLERSPGVERIAVTGDSYVLGFEVPQALNFPSRLEDSLSGAEVYSFGVAGTGTAYHRALFEGTVLPYQPDVVVHTLFWNDILDVQGETPTREVYRRYVIAYHTPEERAAAIDAVDGYLDGGGALLFTLISRVYVVRAAYNALTSGPRRAAPVNELRINLESGAGGTEPARDDPDALAAITEHLTAMHALCEENGCHLLVVALPGKEDYAAGGLHTQPVLDALDAAGVEALSLYEDFEGRPDLFWERDSHYTAAGYDLLAERVAEAVE